MDKAGLFLKIQGVLSIEKGVANDGICDPFFMNVFSMPLSPIDTLKIHFDSTIADLTEIVRTFLISLEQLINASCDNNGCLNRCGIYYEDLTLMHSISEVFAQKIKELKCDDLLIERIPLQKFVVIP